MTSRTPGHIASYVGGHLFVCATLPTAAATYAWAMATVDALGRVPDGSARLAVTVLLPTFILLGVLWAFGAIPHVFRWLAASAISGALFVAGSAAPDWLWTSDAIAASGALGFAVAVFAGTIARPFAGGLEADAIDPKRGVSFVWGLFLASYLVGAATLDAHLAAALLGASALGHAIGRAFARRASA
ncbi:hypothetical protein [Rhodovibrio sodomensis]|uniref:hypothetical protein n=1 Tax=Rhodovibrio sodomensis TaxID=1088 RepID=UPI0019088401|nr:hypothetical protein [Rhodovibrio sodomensis]